MSKVSMPRPRYVAFRIDGPRPLARRAVGAAVRNAAKAAGWPDADAPQLTRYAWPHGIVRVEHTRAAGAKGLLQAITAIDGDAVRVATLSTSGTLDALTSRLGVLTERTD